MKILMVNKFLYKNGGSETYMFKLGEQLAKTGHQVEYFGMEHEGRCVSNSADAYTSDMDFHNSGALQKIKMSLKTIYSKEARIKIRLVLDKFQPDIVHLNNFNYQLTPSIILEIRQWEKESGKSVKIIYTAHDYQLICPNHMMYNNDKICEACIGGKFINCTKGKCVHGSALKSIIGTIEAEYWNRKNVYSQIDTIICCSEFMKKKLDSNPIFKNKTITLHNFVDMVEKKETDKEDYILYFGRFAKEKGIETLAGASSINFVCAGSGPMEDTVNHSPNLENIGFKTGTELETLIRKAKCTVYPSIWYENCPFSVMESIMYGTPVVAANIGGIPELIDNNKTGILFEAGNIKEFENAINSIISDKAKADEMSKACLDYKFDAVSDYCTKLIKIYEN
ncbi:MAG: glycosyltransferase family 4 protein [Acetobacter sp.]|nr:glycosyltransferase family 4 protein [Bacteroides sp.]MCM1341128.1 glycosyltransferase family 4 protein [Acetobacter sp.]MCM1433538.1 glycosyltransferase family 4 protein [Clostridiales bacterium]